MKYRSLLACVPLLISLARFPASEAFAQESTGTCLPGAAHVDLESSFLRARIFNAGNLFYGPEFDVGTHVEAQYVVPAHSDKSPIFAATLQVGGLVSNELRTATATYNNFDFWPGPLGAEGRPPEDCSAFDRVYTVDWRDLEQASCPISPNSDLAVWPAELGAPVIDGDGNPANYDPEAGDRPALLGDQMAWWVMNDAGNDHGEHGTPPIGLEVRGTAFLFGTESGEFSHSPASHELRNTTFYRYELVYKGTTPLEDAYVGLYVDADLGAAGDDFVGTDTTLDLVYAYNSDSPDAVYGENPPAVGVSVLRGPQGTSGETLGLEASPLMWKGFAFPYGEPVEAIHFYNNLKGLYLNGDTIRAGGGGRGSEGAKTLFQFPGDPVSGTYWSEVNADGEGSANSAGDRRFMVSSGPFDMQPGDTEVFEFAVVTAFGDDHLDSISELRAATSEFRRLHDAIYQPVTMQAAACPIHDVPPMTYVRNHPDPAVDRTAFEYTLSAPTHVRLRVFDALGREVAVVVDRRLDEGPHTATYDVSNLASGIYFARFELLDVEVSHPVIVTDPFVVLP